ncbi:MAG: phosphodiester glycosidase family protein [Armatimonadota bacterium]|nr:phosphodiester glycosidase family protein [Armatimonadota bacterium]MDR7470145.1 phosphodiester glycosidase family protein [Armatimonadota bacterium]MDR7537969.1 phosphodiester glycosidase family protein [Armatimonadota bacterium]
MWRHVVILLLLLFPGLVFARAGPPDVAGHWAEGRVRDLLARGIVELYPDGTFRPQQPVSRARFAAWLVAAKGLPLLPAEPMTFSDVHPTSPLAAHIRTADAYGILPTMAQFRPADPLARLEAVEWTVRALGHTFESAYLASAALPFEDVQGLPPLARGMVAVAVLGSPPLLREPPSSHLRPHDPITRGEAASLAWAYLQALEQPAALRATFPLGEGVTLVMEKRGALRALPLWRVQVGAFLDPERAARLAEEMRRRNLPAVVESQDAFFKVRVGNFATRPEAEALAERLAAEGLPTFLVQAVRDPEALLGPVWSAVLVLEGQRGGSLRLRPALAAGQVPGRERTSEIARREGALAAVNGGFFAPGGDPLGCLMIDGELISEPVRGRTCLGILRDGQILLDVLDFDATVSTSTASATVHGVNRERGRDELIVYRRTYGSSTRTNGLGAEAVVVGDVVQRVAAGQGNAPIPPDGYVLSGHGRAAAWIREQLQPGQRIALRLRLVPSSGDPRWQEVVHVVGGGPRLLAGGRYVGGEGFPTAFVQRRHPRTAVARLADGRLILAVIDGRQPYHSLGVTLPELAAFLRALGATDALNLDGGGSTTLVVRGTVVNLPSDEAGERPVSDALLVLRSAAP